MRVCPAGNGHCSCTTSFCPVAERRTAKECWDSDRKELAQRRVAGLGKPNKHTDVEAT